MGIIKNGICGTCEWEIDDKNTLTIKSQNGESGVLCKDCEDDRWPWRPCCRIKMVVIEDGVKTGTYAGRMFAGMADCAEFDVSALNVSAAKNIHGMFEGCSSMENVAGLEKWDVSNVADMSYMFYGCNSLKDISALAGWNVSGVRNMSDMFGDCRALTDISSLKKWDVSKVIDMSCMFCGCKSLTDISPLFEWAISSVCDRAAMFCSAGVSRKTIDAFIPMACPREGAFVGYKKCRDGRIVQLEVPEDAKRSSAYGRKCRCGKAKVLNIWTRYGEEARYAVSIYNSSFVYHKGGTIEVSDFDGDRFDECAAGIHFFMTRKEAEDYVW